MTAVSLTAPRDAFLSEFPVPLIETMRIDVSERGNFIVLIN